MPFKKDIKEIIETIHSKFQDNELAYLALTSKIELPLRDKIAFELHKKYAGEYLVCREWKFKEGNSSERIDLAIVEKSSSNVVCLIEFKAKSVVRFEKEFTTYLTNDLIKISGIAKDDNVELYYIYFNNTISADSDIHSSYNSSIKYLKYLNKNISNKGGTAANSMDHWKKHLKDANLTDSKSNHVSINGGKYYDYPVTIETFIYGPIRKSEIGNLTLTDKTQRT